MTRNVRSRSRVRVRVRERKRPEAPALPAQPRTDSYRPAYSYRPAKFEPGTVKMLMCFFDLRIVGSGYRIVWDVTGPKQRRPMFLDPANLTFWRGSVTDYRRAKEVVFDDPERVLRSFNHTLETYERLKLRPTGQGCTEACRRVQSHLRALIRQKRGPIRTRVRTPED